jgi:hypothetical protein
MTLVRGKYESTPPKTDDSGNLGTGDTGPSDDYMAELNKLSGGGDETGGASDASGGTGFGDDGSSGFVSGDGSSGGAPSGEVPQTPEGMRTYLAGLRDSGEITQSEYTRYVAQVNATVGLSDSAMQTVFSRISGNISAKQAKNISTGDTGDVGGTGDAPPADDPNATLKTELTDYKTAIQNNPNLSDAKKTEYTGKIDQWLQGMDLKTLDAEAIQPLFDDLKTEITTATAFSPAIQSLAQTTGKEPAELEALFKKHGLDPANLPTPPDSKVAALLNDPEFSESIGNLKQGVADAYKGLKSEIDTQTSNANNLNAANVSSDTSNLDNLDVSSFKFLQDATNHTDDKSNALIDARKNLANETANILSAMYGKTVTASTDPTKAGTISFDGTNLNVCTSSLSGDIQFGSKGIDWPDVSRVTYQIDAEGDGQTPIPDWMSKAGYPTHAYDN